MRKSLGSIAVSALVVALGMTGSPAQAEQRMYGKAHPFAIDDLPISRLRTKLERMSPERRAHALARLHRFDFPNSDVRSLELDRQGDVLYVDPAPNAAPAVTAAAAPGVGAIPSTAAFALHSRPGAARVIYLDFDGHVITGTAWNSSYASGQPLNAVAYDTDGVPGSFSTAELNNIVNVWRRVAEDYAPFNVDVTTQLPASFGPTVARVLITRDSDSTGLAMPFQGAGGVAYIGVFGSSSYQTYQPALVYFNRLGAGREDYVAEAASHEMGHNLGLSHDATATSSYYGGHGAGATSWGPIMGTGYNRAVSEWSRGEYAGANNFEDDVAIIAGKLPARTDDHSNTASGASPLIASSSGAVVGTTLDTDWTNVNPQNKGVIGSQSDIDVFYFDAAAGPVNLTIAPHLMPVNTAGGNLDVQVELYNSGGALLGSASPTGGTGAALNVSVPAGRYFLHVAGTGDPTVPYGDYGSLGQFTINGSIAVGVPNTTPPSPNPMTWTAVPTATGTSSVTMQAITAIDDAGSAVQYLFECTLGGAGCASSGWQSSTTYTATGLSPGTTYRYRVKARDASSNETGWSVEAAVTTQSSPVVANSAPVAVADAVSVVRGAAIAINVLANDLDPDRDPLTIISTTKSIRGQVSFTGSGVTYQSLKTAGNDVFQYTISDGKGHTATAAVKVVVTIP
jgi:Bacterial Ig domain/Metallo-peptidase family M12B Reprolysin-like